MVCFTDREIRMIMNDMEEETQSLGYAPLKIEELSQNLQEACFSANWKTLMPVQAHSLPYTLKAMMSWCSPKPAAEKQELSFFRA